MVNSLLLKLGLIAEPLTLIYNRIGVLVAMTHVLLPFMILPLYSGHEGDPAAVHACRRQPGRAAGGRLPAGLPAARRCPAIGAGSLMVFILALGYYITPALVGGAVDQMLQLLRRHLHHRHRQLGARRSARPADARHDARAVCRGAPACQAGASMAMETERRAGPPHAPGPAHRVDRDHCASACWFHLPDGADRGDRAAVVLQRLVPHLSAAGPLAALVRTS